MSIDNAQAFIEKLKEEPFRNQLQSSLLSVPEGDWDAVVRIAQAAGYDFTEEEFKQAVPPGFFKGTGENPDQGWDRSTLNQ